MIVRVTERMMSMKMVDNKTLVTVTGHAISSPQLRFERHPSVHKLFLNMCGEKNQSRHNASVSLVSTKPPATQPCKNLLWMYSLRSLKSELWLREMNDS